MVIFLWPSISCTARKFAPLSIKCVAKECLNVCGLTCLLILTWSESFLMRWKITFKENFKKKIYNSIENIIKYIRKSQLDNKHSSIYFCDILITQNKNVESTFDAIKMLDKNKVSVL